MSRFDGSNPKELKILSNVLDYSGYESVLTVYHSKISDYWIKIANIINPEHKLKYMIAVRTYAISPEYCAMMCEAFNEIDKNRLILNIVAGDVHEDESSQDDVVFISDLIKTHEDRVKYTSVWLEKFNKLTILKNKPELVISGTSSGTLDNSSRYGDAHLCMYSSYIDGLKEMISADRKMVARIVIVRDTKEEAEYIYNMLPESMGKLSCLFGSENDILDSIASMKEDGITDLLISRTELDEEHYRIHSLVKKITGAHNESR